MTELFEKYFSLYKNEIVEENESSEVSLNQYNFKMPIEYAGSSSLQDNVKSDIEFSEENNLFSLFLKDKNNENQKDSLLLSKWSTLYTTNRSFLKDTQTLLKEYVPVQNKMEMFGHEYMNFKNEQNFLSKYQYVQFRRLFYLNTVVGFLQILAVYNICSPLLSLCSPLLGLIIPYFIFYFKGIKMSFKQYKTMVKTLILNNNIVKSLLQFKSCSMQKKLYAFGYLFFYGLGFYNNVMSCIQFFKNTSFMIDFNDKYSIFLEQGNELIETIHKRTKSLKRYSEFNETMIHHQQKIHEMAIKIASLKREQNRYLKCGQIGLLMKCHFDLFYNKEYNDSILYLVHLNQYNKDIGSISSYIKSKHLHKCKFIKESNKKKQTKVKNMYYIAHLHEDDKIPNSICLDKNIIITGPNASGKTTLIKSTIINLFLCQSIGVGCFKQCKTRVYDHFHSYLNIPDTSNRDSLFQAEARRCKNIFEYIQKKNEKERHLCIFDEIYSGTNPKDAVLCANIYLNGMNQHKHHVDYMLTTHYLELCDKFKESEFVKNQKMSVNVMDDKDIQYTYLLEDGVSDIHGGLNVLQKLDYPEELMKKQ